MAERAERGRYSGILVAVGGAFGLWSLLIAGFSLFGSAGTLLRDRSLLLLELGFLAVPLALFPLTLAADARARYVAPVQLLSMGVLGALAGEGASLLYRETDALCLFDVPPIGYGILVLLAMVAATLRLALRVGRKKAPIAAWIIPWVLAALPVARFVRYRRIDPALLAAVGLCVLLALLTSTAIRALAAKDLRRLGVGALLLAGGEVLALLIGPAGVAFVGLEDTWAWLARHAFTVAGIIVLCSAALGYSEAVHG